MLALLALDGCGTVDPGTYEGVRDLKLDESYYYCVIQPQVITPKKCSTGDASEGASSCHGNNTAMRIKDVPMAVACSGGKPIATPSVEERDNFGSAQLRANRDVESSPLITRPTGKVSHPRVIFSSDSAEATLIRQWIRGGK
ncbi:MAG: hypothetical protein NVS3B20_13820 [Polyangiales bacterium]